MHKKIIQTLGVASSIGGPSDTCGQGPLILQESEYAKELTLENDVLSINWHEPLVVNTTEKNSLKLLKKQSCFIAQYCQQQLEDEYNFLVLGGDHSSAIGTWAGVLNALPPESSFALVWIDAHMDAHTLESSPSGNLHGMPVSLLLGEAEHDLQQCFPSHNTLDGRDLYLFGIRSYEADELILLSEQKVNVFDTGRIERDGGTTKVLTKLIETISRCYDYYAISLDLDAIDPKDAPGVETREEGGLTAKNLIKAFKDIKFGANFIGLEIAEFDPGQDENKATEKLVFDIVKSIHINNND